MQLFKNERGSVIFEAILVALVLVAIGSAFYFANKARTTKNDYSVVVPKSTKTQVTTASAPVSPTPNPYAGWKTYSFAPEGISFKYPSDWTFNDASNDNSSANVTITGPSNFRLIFNYGQQGSASANSSCEGLNPCEFDNQQQLTIPNHNSLWLSEYGDQAVGKVEQIGLLDSQQPHTPQLHKTYFYAGKRGASYSVSFSGCYFVITDTSAGCQPETVSAFDQSSAVATAKKIFASISY